jgi:hypothetical protein
MRRFIASLTALAVAAFITAAPVAAQTSYPPAGSSPISGASTSISAQEAAILIKYVGTTTAGIPTVTVAAGGDITLEIAGVADATTGSPTLNGIFDLSTPAAAVDTVGELVTLINTTGSNWRAVLTSGLTGDTTDNTFITLVEREVPTFGVRLFRDVTVALFSSVAILPPLAETEWPFWGVGADQLRSKPNPNAFAGWQCFLQYASERITSAGTVGVFTVSAVKNTYSATGAVTQTRRILWTPTGGATTVATNTPVGLTFVGAPGEFFIVRQETGTDLTVTQVFGTGYMVKVGN